MKVDPQIKVDDAISFFGSQTELANVLNLHKSSITEWKRSKLEMVPPLHAHRLVKLYPDQFVGSSAA